MEKAKQELFNYIMAADLESAKDLIKTWAREHGYQKAVIELVEPVLTTFGDRWAQDKSISIAHGYIAARIAEDSMIKAAESSEQIAEGTAIKGPIVLGNIEDDFHALGRKLVGTFLRLSGWDVYDLGNDVVAREFVDKAQEVGATIIGASAMMYTTALNIKRLRMEIDARGLSGRIRLAAGGAVFKLRPELVAEVGADATAANAIEAPEILYRLIQNNPN